MLGALLTASFSKKCSILWWLCLENAWYSKNLSMLFSWNSDRTVKHYKSSSRLVPICSLRKWRTWSLWRWKKKNPKWASSNPSFWSRSLCTRASLLKLRASLLMNSRKKLMDFTMTFSQRGLPSLISKPFSFNFKKTQHLESLWLLSPSKSMCAICSWLSKAKWLSKKQLLWTKPPFMQSSLTRSSRPSTRK